jgi:hypothetical protein
MKRTTFLLPVLVQILSRGEIVSMNREPRRTLTSVSVFVDHHLAPSFYFVAFCYHRGILVANSLRIDVQAGACEGKVTGVGRDIVCVRGIKKGGGQGDCPRGIDLV